MAFGESISMATAREVILRDDGSIGRLGSLSLREGEPWQMRARCAQTDSEVFFPGTGESTNDAKKVCASCEVIVECLKNTLDMEEQPSGIWGGLSGRTRRKLKRERERAA
jgi:WhiB family redox-sensing transcriptional regulator